MKKSLKYVFVVTGMSYIIDSSGTSNVVKAHQKIFVNEGINYVVIFPISRSKGEGINWHVTTTGCYALVINGVFIRVMTTKQVVNYLMNYQKAGNRCIGILIHHLIRNNLSDIEHILQKINDVPIIFYLHDYYTVCFNHNMLKDDEISCIDDEMSCKGCVYEEKRDKHKAAISSFIDLFSNRITFVAPSQYTLERWLHYYPQFQKISTFIPHQKCLGKYSDNKSIIPETAPIRIAFIGTQTHAKGWDIYKKIVQDLVKAKCNYDFYYFGKGKEQIQQIKNIFIETSKMGKNAAINELRNNKIDVVFLTSIWAETYSYTMYESIASNAYIITLNNSGNIAYTVRMENLGRVFESAESIKEFFSKEKDFRSELNNWKQNAKPGFERYDDNDDILHFFPTSSHATISGPLESITCLQALKSFALNILFRNCRLK